MAACLQWLHRNHPVWPPSLLQHEASQGPGILRDHLQQQGLANQWLPPCAEGSAPIHANDYSGIVVLGSNHCANKDLGWMRQTRGCCERSVTI